MIAQDADCTILLVDYGFMYRLMTQPIFNSQLRTMSNKELDDVDMTFSTSKMQRGPPRSINTIYVGALFY